MNERILIVEDEKDLANLVDINLTQLGYRVEQCHDGRRGLNRALKEDYDLIILDIMLPEIDGLEICRQIRETDNLTPILMLTARNTETDRVIGLEMGSDDYLTKPFGVRELQARVKALLRRSQVAGRETKERSELVAGEVSIDIEAHLAKVDGRELQLTSTEFDLLLYLMKNPGQVFSRTQLLNAVWGYNHLGYEHTVNSHINRLRAKLEADPSNPRFVHTVWGVGYKFEIKEQTA